MSVRPHPSIPDSELRSRPEALGSALAKAGFDGWLAFGDDRAVAGPDHIRYLSDLEPHFEPVFIAGRAGDSDAVLLTGPETIGYAAVVAKRIATLGTGAVSAPVWQRLFVPLVSGGLDFEAADGIAYGLRAVKTASEQAVIDESYRIARVGLEAAADAIRPGVTERHVAADAEAAMRRAGAEGFGIDTMVASGVDNTAPILARSTFRVIGADDLVAVTIAPRYEGYHAALARAFLFRPNSHVEKAIETARNGQRAAVEHMIVGTEGRVCAQALRDVLEGAGTGADLPYVPVHSVGLIEFEPPIFLSSSDVRIHDGM